MPTGIRSASPAAASALPARRSDDTDLPRFTRVVAVVDVVESVRLMQQDETGFIRRWQAFLEFVRSWLLPEVGRLRKSLGDGLMLEFVEPQSCMRSVLAMQHWFAAGNQRLPAEQRVHLRIGAHVANFVADEYDIYGKDVNLTARIAGLAGPGEIVVSAALRDQLKTFPEAQLEDLGACHLRHLEHPVLAYRLGLPGPAPVLPDLAGAASQLRAGIAVLPFAGSSSIGEEQWLGEVLADAAVVALARVAELQVISRLSTEHFRDDRPALAGFTRSVQPHYVLRGRARRGPTEVALFAELADAGTGAVVWARSLHTPAPDLLRSDAAMPGELARAISGAVVRHELTRSLGQPLPHLEAHTLLLAAIALMHRRKAPDMARAKAMLEHLAERHRRQPAASAWLAYWHLLQLQHVAATEADRHAQGVQDHCLASLQTDAESPLALCMDGHARLHLQKDLEGAGQRFAQVLDAWPEDALAWLFLSEQLALAGEGAEALQAARQALALSSLAPMRYLCEHAAAVAALTAGQLQQACAYAERSLRANPSHPAAYQTLALAQIAAGSAAQARGTVGRLLAVDPHFSIAVFLQRSPAAREVALRQAEALASAGAPQG